MLKPYCCNIGLWNNLICKIDKSLGQIELIVNTFEIGYSQKQVKGGQDKVDKDFHAIEIRG